MKEIVFLLAILAAQTAGHYSVAGGGYWTFRTGHCQANKFIHHRESQTIFDTTQTPHPKFIIDFYRPEFIADGTFRVVRGQPKAADQVSIGVGWLNTGVLTFYSSTGGSGTETVTVKMINGKPHISGAGIELANQQNAADRSPLTFDITIE